MLFGFIIFFSAVVLIVTLFALKYYEGRVDRVLAPSLRLRADKGALEFKAWIGHAHIELQKFPPTLLHFSHLAVHEAALGAAASGRLIERQAHRLADMVSHKRGFTPREPRSEFLKRITEHKNDLSGQDNGLDITEGNGHNTPT